MHAKQVIRLTLIVFTALLIVQPVAAADKTDAKKTKPAKTRDVKIEDLQLTVPVSWKQTPPTSRLRKAQFEIPAVKGDKSKVELRIYEFSGGGGGVSANIRRWIGQFQSKGRKVTIRKGECKQGPYHIVDITGTFNQPIGAPFRRQTKLLPNARMIGVILSVKAKRKVYYLKMAGGAKTVSANEAALRAAFGGDAKKEKELPSTKKAKKD